MRQITKTVLYTSLSGLDSIKFPKGRFGLVIEDNDVIYEFLLNVKENADKLLCLGSGCHGSKITDNRQRPYFNRWSWNFEGFSTVNYNDPTLYLNDEVLSGWCLGTKDNWYLLTIKNILVKIARKLGIVNNKILFYGSSAGGTTSLMLGTLIRNSMVLADMPQTDVSKFVQSDKVKLPPYWPNIKKYCFDCVDDKEAYDKYGYRFNLFEFLKKEEYIPNALLLCDVSHFPDYKKSYKPFIDKIHELPFNKNQNSLKFIFYGKKEGHSAASKKTTLFIIKNIELYLKTVVDVEVKNFLSKSEEISEINPHYLEMLYKYITSRIDIKNYGTEDNDIEFLEISDRHANIKKPKWFTDAKGHGTVIESINTRLNMKFRCIGNGNLYIHFKGIDQPDTNNNRFPIYIDYTKLLVDGIPVINKNTLTTHDKPIVYDKKVSSDQIIEVTAEWKPFDSSSEFNE